MGSTRLRAARVAGDNAQDLPAAPPGPAAINGAQGGAEGNIMTRHLRKAKAEREAKAQADTAALSAAEQAAAKKTAELANSAGGGANINTNGQGSSSYTEGNPGQDDNQSQGDVDLSTSDTTFRRRGGYTRDNGIRI